MCLAQGHNAVMPVRLEPVAWRSWVKCSTTEPLHSLNGSVEVSHLQVKNSIDSISAFWILLHVLFLSLRVIFFNIIFFKILWGIQWVSNSLDPDHAKVINRWRETERQRPTNWKTHNIFAYSKICVKWPLSKRQKFVFQDQLSLNAGQKYCRMLPLAFCNTFHPSLSYHLSFFLFLSIFEWTFTQVFCTCITVNILLKCSTEQSLPLKVFLKALSVIVHPFSTCKQNRRLSVWDICANIYIFKASL